MTEAKKFYHNTRLKESLDDDLKRKAQQRAADYGRALDEVVARFLVVDPAKTREFLVTDGRAKEFVEAILPMVSPDMKKEDLFVFSYETLEKLDNTSERYYKGELSKSRSPSRLLSKVVPPHPASSRSSLCLPLPAWSASLR